MSEIDAVNAVNPRHLSTTNEHYTPIEIIEAARQTMGEIDLDPATTKRVNETRVKATNFFTREDRALSLQWHGRVWLNPPGGLDVSTRKSNAAVWWSKLVEEYRADRVREAIFLGFTLEIFATSQDADMWIGDFPFCVPRQRIAFWKDGALEGYVRGGSPAHSNVIVYLPPRDGNTIAFKHAFEKFGRVSTT